MRRIHCKTVKEHAEQDTLESKCLAAGGHYWQYCGLGEYECSHCGAYYPYDDFWKASAICIGTLEDLKKHLKGKNLCQT